MTTPLPLHSLALAALACLIAVPASAQDSYNYFGLGVGQSRSRIDELRSAEGLLGNNGPAIVDLQRDSKDVSYKLFMGRQFNRYFGVEAGFFQLGEFTYRATTVPDGTLDGRLKVQGGGIDAVLTMPLGETFSLLGRAGVQYARVRNDIVGTGAGTVANTSPSQREMNPKIGVGMQVALGSAVLLRGELERYRIADALGKSGNIDMMSVSLVFPFGRSAAPMPRAEAPPPYVAPVAMTAPAPAPAPVMVVVESPPPVVVQAPAPPPAPRRVSFSAESLFGFDKSTVRPEGMQALDGFARELDGTEYVTINVEGHTDRIGSEAYNQTLSLERADAVKAYLVSSGRIPAGKISAVGKGETMPVTVAADCKGDRQSAQLVTCLQPDRRVEIEVIGTR